MGLGIIHNAGPLVEGVQSCTRCHEILCDYRTSATQSLASQLSGFPPGPVTVYDRRAFVAGVGDNSISCAELTGN